MLEIGYNPIGILNTSGLVHVGEGYYNNLSVYESIDGDFNFNAMGTPFSPSAYINRNSENNITYFPSVIRFLSEDGERVIIQNASLFSGNIVYNSEELAFFLNDIQGYTLVGSPAITKSTFSYPGTRYPNSNIPQARDALAYNLIVKNQTIPPLNTWRWFKASNTPIASSIFGECAGDGRLATPRPENYDGYYTNIYNTVPNDNEVWLYNYTTPHTSLLVPRDGTPSQAFGGATWLISGRPSVYKNDGREIYWLVSGYKFDKNWSNTTFFNKVKSSGELLDQNSNLGLPYPNARYLDIKNIPTTNTFSAGSYPSAKFIWSGSINRWVFNLTTRICRSRGIIDGKEDRYITGLNSGEYPWTTNWPNNIDLSLLN